MKKLIAILFVTFALLSCGGVNEEKIETVIDSITVVEDTTVVTTVPVTVDTTVVKVEEVTK
jgi:hypothetical protein